MTHDEGSRGILFEIRIVFSSVEKYMMAGFLSTTYSLELQNMPILADNLHLNL